MKNAQPLDFLLGSPARVAVLRVLVATRTELTGGETARLAGVSWPQALEALKKFVETGLVSRKRAGGGGLYLLNRDRELVRRGIIPLFDTEKVLIATALKKFVGGLSSLSPESVVLFGSTARGDRGPRSDVDVLVILPRKIARAAEAVAESAAKAGSVAGFRISPLLLSIAEVKKATGSKKDLIENIRAEGKRLAGRELNEVIRGKSA
ncbi:MAG: nucleotidyltransferase domain-containing protein [Candidatus Hydrogenedentota bacterium]